MTEKRTRKSRTAPLKKAVLLLPYFTDNIVTHYLSVITFNNSDMMNLLKLLSLI